MIKLISLDLDGTFLNSDKLIDEDNIKTVRKMKNLGAMVVICTGRSFVGIPDCVKELDFIDYYVTSNGTSIYDVSSNKKIYSDWLSCELACEVDNLLLEDNVAIDFLCDGEWHMSSASRNLLDKIIKDKSVLKYVCETRMFHEDIHDFLRNNHEYVEKLTINFDDSTTSLDTIKTKLIGLDIRLWSDKKHKIDAYNVSATKGNAIKKLCQINSVVMDEVIAFGDDENDYELLSYAGYSVAMGNATDTIKKCAKYITTSNDELGVAVVLQKFLDC